MADSEVFGVFAEAFLGVEVDAALEVVGAEAVELRGVPVGRLGLVFEAVGDEFVAPAEAVDDAGIVGGEGGGLFEGGEAFGEGELAGDQGGAEVAPGVDVVRFEGDGFSDGSNGFVDVVIGVELVGAHEERAGVVGGHGASLTGRRSLFGVRLPAIFDHARGVTSGLEAG